MSRSSIWAAALLVLLAAAAVSCGDDTATDPGDPPAEPIAVSVTRDIPYMTDAQRWGFGGNVLSADSSTVMHRYVPEGEGPWPVVVLLHGGFQNAENMEAPARAIAARGVIVYTPTYLHDLQADAEQVASGLWAGGTTVGDLSCAVRAARADADEHGGVPDHLIVVGYSMGAGFGATVTLVGDDPERTEGTSGDCVVSEGSAVPAAFIGWEGPYDWEMLLGRDFPDTLDLAPEAVRAMSPLTHAELQPGDRAPAFHLRSGDRVWKGVPHADYMDHLAAELTETGWSVTTEVLPGRFHTDFVEAPFIPEMIDLIVEVAYDPSE